MESTLAVPIPTAAVNVDYLSLGSKATGIAAAASAIGQLGAGEGSFFQNVVEKGKNFVANLRTGNTAALASGAKNAASNILSTAMAAKATAEITGQQGSYTLFDTQSLTLCTLGVDNDNGLDGSVVTGSRILNDLHIADEV